MLHIDHLAGLGLGMGIAKTDVTVADARGKQARAVGQHRRHALPPVRRGHGHGEGDAPLPALAAAGRQPQQRHGRHDLRRRGRRRHGRGTGGGRRGPGPHFRQQGRVGVAASTVLRMLERGTCSRRQRENLRELGFPEESLAEVRGGAWPLPRKGASMEMMHETRQKGDENA